MFFLTNKEITALCYNIFHFQNLLESEKEKRSVKSKQKSFEIFKTSSQSSSAVLRKNDQEKEVIYLQALQKATLLNENGTLSTYRNQ